MDLGGQGTVTLAGRNDHSNFYKWITQLTYADFATYLLFDYVVANIPGSTEKYPSLTKLKNNVESLPNISTWLKTRPTTDL